MKTDLKFTEVGGHTFCPELLSDGVIIDVGARGFVFSKAFPGRQVYCIDPDPKVFDGVPGWFNGMDGTTPVYARNINVAISDKTGEAAYYENGEATCLKQIDPDQSHPFIPCRTITMDDLYEITGTNVDVLKLDCEGAEYIILGETFKPIPKQISVEFHAHTVPEMHAANYPAIKERLLKDYEMFNEVWEKRHGCPENVWDVLFIRRDLL